MANIKVVDSILAHHSNHLPVLTFCLTGVLNYLLNTLLSHPPLCNNAVHHLETTWPMNTPQSETGGL